MEDLPLDIIAALVHEFAVKDLSLGRTLMMMMMMMMNRSCRLWPGTRMAKLNLGQVSCSCYALQEVSC